MVRLPAHALAMWCTRIHHRCQLCGRSKIGQDKSALVCSHCHQLIKQVPILKLAQGLPLCVGGFYDMPLKRVMSQYKDKGDLSALLVLYHIIDQIPKPSNLPADTLIVPVPTTDSRLIKRGFNPVLTLARFLSYRWQIPIWQGVARTDNQTRQRGLDKHARLQNVQGDFYLLDTPPAKWLIVFDDVITTGATIKAVAEVLQTASPATKVLAIGVLHGKPDLHLPKYA